MALNAQSINKVSIIYALVNPYTNNIFYVGSTKSSLPATLSRHLKISAKGANVKKNIEIKKILVSGKKPLIKELCRCKPKDQFKTEWEWINRLYDECHNLTNMVYKRF